MASSIGDIVRQGQWCEQMLAAGLLYMYNLDVRRVVALLRHCSLERWGGKNKG
ncbi:hypothetical protein J6590_030069 [Homalodisca vitripennis]|nr:hypothetical protein J6590_030069 [Homalodisca vitripennis]